MEFLRSLNRRRNSDHTFRELLQSGTLCIHGGDILPGTRPRLNDDSRNLHGFEVRDSFRSRTLTQPDKDFERGVRPACLSAQLVETRENRPELLPGEGETHPTISQRGGSSEGCVAGSSEADRHRPLR